MKEVLKRSNMFAGGWGDTGMEKAREPTASICRV